MNFIEKNRCGTPVEKSPTLITKTTTQSINLMKLHYELEGVAVADKDEVIRNFYDKQLREA